MVCAEDRYSRDRDAADGEEHDEVKEHVDPVDDGLVVVLVGQVEECSNKGPGNLTILSFKLSISFCLPASAVATERSLMAPSMDGRRASAADGPAGAGDVEGGPPGTAEAEAFETARDIVAA